MFQKEMAFVIKPMQLLLPLLSENDYCWKALQPVLETKYTSKMMAGENQK